MSLSISAAAISIDRLSLQMLIKPQIFILRPEQSRNTHLQVLLCKKYNNIRIFNENTIKLQQMDFHNTMA